MPQGAPAIPISEILANHTRGGFVVTRVVSQRLGAFVTRVGIARGWHPASVTLSSLAVSLATSAAVVLLGSGAWTAAIALAGWQAAYALDCTDGQLARATGRASDAGGALDLYSDAVGRLALAAALLTTIASRDLELATPWVAVLVAGLLASLFHEAAGRTSAVAGVTRTPAYEAVGAIRDPAVQYMVFAVSLALPPEWTVAALLYGAVLGGAQFVVRLARLTVLAHRA